MRRLAAVLLGTAPLWLAVPGFAQATPEGAAELQNALAGLYAQAMGTGGQGLFQGSWTVEPAGATYRVTMPGSASSSTTAASDGTTVTMESGCDSSGGSAVPVSDGVYRLRLDTPFDCHFKSSQGPIDVRVTTRSRVDEFTFDTRGKVFSKMASTWEGLTATPVKGGGPALLTIDRLTGAGDGAPAGESGRQSLDYHLSAEGLRGSSPDGTVQVSIGRLGLDGASKDFDLGGVFAKLAEMVAVQRAMAASAPGTTSPEDQRRMMGLVGGIYAAYGNTVDGGLSVGDLQVSWPQGKVTLAAANVALGYGGIDGDAGTGRLRYGVEGLTISPASPYADWIPHDGRIDLAVDKIPYQSIFKLIGDAIAAQTKPSLNPEETLQFQAQVGRAIGMALQQAGSTIDIPRFRVVAPQLVFDLTGAFQASLQAVFGVNGDAKLRLVGLDPLIELLQATPGREAAGVIMIQTLGRQATAEGGRPARDYDIVVDDAGKILVNGTDLAALAPKQ